MKPSWKAALLCGCLGIIACKGEPDSGSSSSGCVPGDNQECTCHDGTPGHQECDPDGTRWGACYVCPDATTSSSGATSSAATSLSLPSSSATSGPSSTALSSSPSSSSLGQASSVAAATSSVSLAGSSLGTGASSGGSMVGHPPVLTLSTQTPTLTYDPYATFLFTAVVTDADGQGDIADVFLTDSTGTLSYGAMARASETTWTLGISWSTVNATEVINTPAGGGGRTFRAYALDRASNRGFGETSVALRCVASGDAFCDGQCQDLQTSHQHCGQCNHPVPGSLSCINGAPGCYPYNTQPQTACGDSCSPLVNDWENCGGCGNSCAQHLSTAGFSASTGGTCESSVCVAMPINVSSTGQRCSTVCSSKGWSCRTGWADYNNSYGFRVLTGCSTVAPAQIAWNRTLTLYATTCECAETSLPFTQPTTGGACTSSAGCATPAWANDANNFGIPVCATGADHPNGMCYLPDCRLDSECGSNGRCVNVSFNTTPVFRCMRNCASTACRSGYQCLTVPNILQGTSDVCFGGCSLNNRCPAGLSCVSGQCL